MHSPAPSTTRASASLIEALPARSASNIAHPCACTNSDELPVPASESSMARLLHRPPRLRVPVFVAFFRVLSRPVASTPCQPHVGNATARPQIRPAGANNGGFRERVGSATRHRSPPHAGWMRQTFYSTPTPRRFAHRIATSCAVNQPPRPPTIHRSATDDPPISHR